LASGGGSNLQAIMDACREGVLDADVVGVVSNRSDAFALRRAADAGIPTAVVPVDGRSRAIYDGVLAHAVGNYEPDLVVLAGWMRVLSDAFVSRFDVINIHPALPGAFPGIGAIERSFAAWQNGEISEGGVMVHWVPDSGVDDGPVIAQRSVSFVEGDTLETFEQRVHDVEHELFVAALDAVISNGSVISDDSVISDESVLSDSLSAANRSTAAPTARETTGAP
jgi:formyltetrahydrofolate-dependent phosphoribosylglycinamide formyltransferase